MADTDREARERFAANIERLRRREGLSVEELAGRSEVDAGELGEILRADREADYGTIAALAAAEPFDVRGEAFPCLFVRVGHGCPRGRPWEIDPSHSGPPVQITDSSR